MASFQKKKYTNPVVCNHCNDLTKDWYVFFRFKHEGKEYKFKRREGINRIKNLEARLSALNELVNELRYDLKYGWNPLEDPKRELIYSPIKTLTTSVRPKKVKQKSNKPTKEELKLRFHSKGLF